MARRTALHLASTRPGRRLLEFYSANGLVPATGDGVHVEAPVPSPPVGPGRAPDARAAFLESMWDRFLPRLPPPTFEDLTEQPADDSVPPLDRHDPPAGELTADQQHWRSNGYLLKQKFLPDELVDAYWSVRSKVEDPHAWHSPVPYMHIAEALDLSVYRPLTDLLEQLIGEPMASI